MLRVIYHFTFPFSRLVYYSTRQNCKSECISKKLFLDTDSQFRNQIEISNRKSLFQVSVVSSKFSCSCCFIGYSNDPVKYISRNSDKNGAFRIKKMHDVYVIRKKYERETFFCMFFYLSLLKKIILYLKFQFQIRKLI